MSVSKKHITSKEIKNKIKDGKLPGYDLIKDKSPKHLKNKTILQITFIFNSMSRLSYYA